MPKQTDTLENVIIRGNLSVIPNEENSLDYGPGNIECIGSLCADSIIENTDDTGVTIDGVLIKDQRITLATSTPPITPNVNEITLFVDGGFLKSKNSADTVKIYNPMTTNGDLITHDGVTDIRLPLGENGNVLVAKSSGLEWDFIRAKKSNFTLIDTGASNGEYVIPQVYGSHIITVYSQNYGGSSCVFFICKSNRALSSGGVTRFVSSPSLTSSGLLSVNYLSYRDPLIYKGYSEGKGTYGMWNNYQNNNTEVVTLSGVAPVSTAFTDTTGAHCISVTSENLSATFLACKSNSGLSTGNIIRVTSTPSNGNISLTWGAGEGIKLQQSTVSNDGNYTLIDNFRDTHEYTVTLTGTSLVLLNTQRYTGCYIVRVTSVVSGAPVAIGMISKNIPSLNGVNTIIRSPGSGTSNLLELTWPVNSDLYLKKTQSSYDGVYTVEISRYL